MGLLALTACSSGDGRAAAARTETRPTGPTTTEPVSASSSSTIIVDAGTQLRQAERAFWDLYLELGARRSPFDRRLTRQRLSTRTTGRESARLFTFFEGNAALGYVIRGRVDIAPTIVSVSGNTARIRDCYDDRTGLYRATDGSRVDTDNPARQQVLMRFALERGIWKVADITDEGRPCDA